MIIEAVRIQILKFSKDTYWYAGYIGNQYWAIKTKKEFEIIHEGNTNLKPTGFVDFDDAFVLQESRIKVEKIESTVITKLEG